MVSAPKKLAAWLERHGVRQTHVASTLGLNAATVSYWLSADRVPEQRYREALERWTGGAVAADSWLSSEERRELERLRKLEPHR
jgi:predicted transcriptional regulator